MEKTFSILTLGCKVNQYESEAMSELFESRGYRQVENDDFSDVYIVNTCTVTNLSDRKSRQFIRKSKKNNPNSVVAVVGCYSQVSPEEVKSIEGVDVVVGTTERNRIVDLIEESKKNNEKINIVKELKNVREFANTTNFDSNNRTRAYMKVQDGCNRFCTYCIIPFARGPIRSRTIEDSVREARTLADRGFKEIVLTGIHIGSFGMDLGDMRLIDLIEAIAEVDGIERIRLSSVEPLIITDDFMERAVKTGKLCDHFHLSLQSGSNNILKAMNRRYTREDYIEKANIIRKYMPHAGLTTDIIVGFPGESQEDFEDSMKIVKEVGFSRIHVFKYSKRKNTRAAVMKNQIDGNVKKERSEKLIALGEEYQEIFERENMKTTQSVLFEEKHDGVYYGYTTNYIRVKAKSEEDLTNKIKKVKILDTGEIANCEVLGD
ncbi:tRNA (N(6)-L-threonylcarbamoyladenosine(37)-C(2))-methylthiotransferase MtaB [Peptoniphilus harei]|uniref:tRNA (N(6)-L-threonylcarbamoyladenosine(37)-C(2))-methylthiotransferase MtaB n=1 Tax=Peptoniphilus genitalis TaxID=3036303 RepID=A0ABY4TPC2_9FIRM|nr:MULTISPECIES: tRNA (N(6)-L-threonylcarbamoyladenosine(37)-C(2))-methylthiotransferase MtaB [Peptoniphilus]MDK7376708.1 tRNA (N(6)-L-threonylcarbamoyladenosine(37)-C(2))-methylthiotransferase MtaB [Peptoniphilus harei]MDK7679326.1 tRNA (N(6)-L-threonylcarbamoyladenosine(37)-C(2))-methylthiotransferase MtaB [Peptoniphilus harei]URN41584.1 tRNA (N(6)-L-threonylcarbamoyladenosine(37)-C(2))-methylthiotransferase MtaB [Peptoniphilus sp. SAHP1]